MMAGVGKLASTGSGVGGYSHKKITEEILMATFDNLYRRCYNKCNDDNKNVICHQSPKFSLYGVFAIRDIKSH